MKTTLFTKQNKLMVGQGLEPSEYSIDYMPLYSKSALIPKLPLKEKGKNTITCIFIKYFRNNSFASSSSQPPGPLLKFLGT